MAAVGPTRRDFVGMLLGAAGGAAAAGAAGGAACGGAGAPRIPPGVLVETGARRGHAALRDLAAGGAGGAGGAGAVAPGRWRAHRVVIVGAGIAGLGAAWELRRRGIADVVVLELDDVFGGTARGGESPVTRYPWGAHYIVAPQRNQPHLIALLEELGAIERYLPDGTPIAAEELRCRELEERVFYRGRWYEGLYLEAGASAEDLRQHAAFKREIARWATFRDEAGRRAFALPVSQASELPELRALDGLSFGAWLDARGLTSERLRWLCDYSCRDDYALTAADTSAWAGLFYFASRRSGFGSTYQSVLTWPDGNGALVRHLAAGARIETGVAVTRVGEDGTIHALGPDGPFGVRAERVVVAVPGFVADRLVPGRPALPDDHGAWAVANVHLRARPREVRGAPPAWDSVFRDSPSLGYVCATHQRGRDRGPTVWTWFYPFTGPGPEARRQVAGASYEDWAEVVLADLSRAHRDIREHVERMEIAFWGHGMIRPRPGAMFHPARAARVLPRGRIHFAHTDLSGIALFEEALDHGVRAAREIAEALA
ncbi:MAG TPA: FAD-dependent oxidoreductase [Kofleriaceae bacterium]|nr:FAD-dependent oxidoreductase [Kofleriaceae bacterium]